MGTANPPREMAYLCTITPPEHFSKRVKSHTDKVTNHVKCHEK